MTMEQILEQCSLKEMEVGQIKGYKQPLDAEKGKQPDEEKTLHENDLALLCDTIDTNCKVKEN